MNRSPEILLYNQLAPPVLAPPEYVDFSSVISLLSQRKLRMAICLGAGLFLALAFGFTQQKVYESRASIEIQIPNEDYLNRRQLNPVSELNTIMLEPFLQTQLRLIDSDTMLLKVAHQLDLASLPEYSYAPSFMTRLKNGLRRIERKPPTDLELLEMIRARLNLRLAGQTQIVDITYESTDPALAAKMANGIAETYQTASLSATNGSASQTAALLSTQIKGMRTALDESEARLRNFVDSNKLLATSNQESVAQLGLRQLQTDLGVAHDARVAAQSKYETLSAAAPELLAQQLDSDTLRAYRLKLTELRQQYAENIQIYTPQHYKIRQLQAEIEEVQQSFDRERAGILGRLWNDYRSDESRENALAKDYEEQARLVAAQSGQSINYESLKHDVDMNRQIYDATLQKVKEADLAAALEASNVRIVDHAMPAELPAKPNILLFAGIGLGAGFLFGMVLVFTQARDPKIGPAAMVQEPLFQPATQTRTGLPVEPLVIGTRERLDPLAIAPNWLTRTSEIGSGQALSVGGISPRQSGPEEFSNLAKTRNVRTYLTFRVARQNFAIAASHVRGILPLHEMIPLDCTPEWICGIASIPSHGFPVIDLRLKLAIPAAARGRQSCIVAVEVRQVLIGFIADRVSEMLELTPLDIHSDHVRVNGRLRRLLRPDHILSGASVYLSQFLQPRSLTDGSHQENTPSTTRDFISAAQPTRGDVARML